MLLFVVLLQLLPLTKLIGKRQWKSTEEQPRRLCEDAAFCCLFKFCERCVPLINTASSFNEAHCWSRCSSQEEEQGEEDESVVAGCKEQPLGPMSQFKVLHGVLE